MLALTKYGPLAASTRQRFLQYSAAFAAAGIELTYSPLLGDDHVARLVEGKRANPSGAMRAYLRRLGALWQARKFDLLWVHCELFPYLPGAFERLARLWRKPVVFDYDDAIFHMYDASANPIVRAVLGQKLVPLIRAADACTCGNAYLRDYAIRYNRRAFIVPTVVDTDRYHPVQKAEGNRTTIGWIGSPSTWANVRPLLPLLSELCARTGASFKAIGAGRGADSDRFEGMELVEWSETSEINEVQSLDIGIMPLIDRPFERGKSGYKLIQYMACALPVIASPIGVNAEIVSVGKNGYLAGTEEQWRSALERLLSEPNLRRTLGEGGRERAIERYSLSSQAPRLVALFHSLVEVQAPPSLQTGTALH